MNENVILIVLLVGIMVICIGVSFIKELFNILETKKIIEECHDGKYEVDIDFIFDVLPHVITNKDLLKEIYGCLGQINMNTQINDLKKENKNLKEMLDLNISASVEIVEGEEDDVDKRTK